MVRFSAIFSILPGIANEILWIPLIPKNRASTKKVETAHLARWAFATPKGFHQKIFVDLRIDDCRFYSRLQQSPLRCVAQQRNPFPESPLFDLGPTKIAVPARLHCERLDTWSVESFVPAKIVASQVFSCRWWKECIIRDTINYGKAIGQSILAEAGQGISLCQYHLHLYTSASQMQLLTKGLGVTRGLGGII